MIAFTLIGMIGLGSCKQNWECQCTDKGTTTPINGGTLLHAKHTCHAMGDKCDLLTVER